MAQITRRHFTADATSLPFVAEVKVAPRKTRISYWHVKATNDYAVACSTGRQYACDMVQFMKDNPGVAGSNFLGNLVRDMAALPPASDAGGYAVGFWSVIEEVLHAALQGADHWSFVQSIEDRYEALGRGREYEVKSAAYPAVPRAGQEARQPRRSPRASQR